MPINRYLLKKEKAFAKSMYRYFRKSEKQIAKLLKEQDTQKAFWDDLKELLLEIVSWTAVLISKRSRSVIEKGTKETLKYNPDFKINWDLRNDDAVRYLEDIKTKHSDIFLKGSIWETTYRRVIDAISKWVDEWLSYTEVWKQLTEIDWAVFSESRARAIAVSELWTAYEQWKYLPMKDLQDSWEIVLKKWQTVEDERVRPTHRQNQDDWYIPLDLPFSWTGTKIAPNPPSCRCSLIYKVI